MRLINEDDVLRIVERVTNEAVEKNQRKYLIQPRIIAEIAGLPTIEAEPVKHGRWEVRTQKDGTTIGQHNVTYCSECGYVLFTKEDSFCARCGAKMDLKDGDSDDEP